MRQSQLEVKRIRKQKKIEMKEKKKEEARRKKKEKKTAKPTLLWKRISTFKRLNFLNLKPLFQFLKKFSVMKRHCISFWFEERLVDICKTWVWENVFTVSPFLPDHQKSAEQ